MRKIETLRFGEIEIDEKKIIHFNRGIPAYSSEKEFVLIPYNPKDPTESPYLFMQSVKSPDLAFFITSPYYFFQDYEFEIADDVISELDIQSPDDILVYVIITVPGGSVKDMTANLLAPVIINTKNLQAKQNVIENSSYTTKHRLFPAEDTKSDSRPKTMKIGMKR